MRLPTICFCLTATIASAGEDHDHLAETEGVRVLHAWTNAGDGADARVYMEIENTGGAAQTLTGGESATAGHVELLGMSIGASDAAAEAVGAVQIEPGGELVLEPGGLFLLLTAIDSPLVEGEAFPMEVHFDPAGHVEVEVQVEAQDATAHSHAGHSH